MVASETCAFDLVGAEFIRDIEPGEILHISKEGKLTSDYSLRGQEKAFCVFEYVYFARPDSLSKERMFIMYGKILVRN